MLSASKIIKLSNLFIAAGNKGMRRQQLQIVRKFANLSFVHLKKNKHNIDPEIRRYIVTMLIRKDGVRSDFVPADMADFAEDDAQANIQRLGLKLKSDSAEIPEGWHKTQIEEDLLGGVDLDARYIPSNTKISYESLK